MKDPADPSGPNQTLCQLFEKGIIHEVWCMASQNPKCGETQEKKQRYDANGNKMAGSFVSASNGDNITTGTNALPCGVTVRITDFNSGRGTGCHQHAMGHAWERYMDASAVPSLRKEAARFLNWDLMTRLDAPFHELLQRVQQQRLAADRLPGLAIEHPRRVGQQRVARVRHRGHVRRLRQRALLRQHDGDVFVRREQPRPDGAVVLRELRPAQRHRRQGPDHAVHQRDDRYALRPQPQPDQRRVPGTATPACSDDCGGHGSTYLYQNFPGPGTKSTNDDGTPMHNWWVYLFY